MVRDTSPPNDLTAQENSIILLTSKIYSNILVSEMFSSAPMQLQAEQKIGDERLTSENEANERDEQISLVQEEIKALGSS